MRNPVMALLAVLLFLGPGDRQAQAARKKGAAGNAGAVVIVFDGLDGARPDPRHGRSYTLSSVARASGSVRNLPRDGSVWIGLRHVGSGVWLTHKARVVRDHTRVAWRGLIALPVLAEQDGSLEVIAMAANGSSMPAAVEQRSLHRYCADASDPITLNPDAARPARANRRAVTRTRLYLTRIGDRPTGRSMIVPVAEHEPVFATVRNPPEGAVLQAVVQPVEDASCWAMSGYTRPYRGCWQGTAYFGREGRDRFKRYWVYVMATRRPMPTGRQITREEWRNWKLLAVSPPVSAIRTVDPGELRVRIERIDGDKVGSRGVWLAANGSRVEGTIDYYGTNGEEQGVDGGAAELLLLSAPEGRDAWWVSGVALARSRGSQWSVVSAKLGLTAGRRKLLAVVLAPPASDQPVRGWHKGDVFADWKRVLAFSDEVRVRVQDPSGGSSAAGTAEPPVAKHTVPRAAAPIAAKPSR